MTKYKGSWAKGFASTFDPVGGINLGLQWKEKKAKEKKIDDEIEQLKISAMELAAKFDMARADGTITQQEFGDAMTWAIPLGKEISGRTETLYKNYMDMTPDQLKTELENIKAILEFSKDLDFTNLEQMKEFGNKLTQPNAKMQWDLIIESIEKRGKPMQAEIFTSAEAVREKYPEAGVRYTEEGYVPTFGEPTEVKEPTFSEKRFNWKIEQYKQGRITLNQLLESEGIDMSPEKATGLEKQIQDIKKEGERAGIDSAKINKAIQDKILGVTPEPKPETVTTLKNWEKMFDIKAEEGPRTEEDYNRALELLAQSEDKYKPKYPTWKEALIAEVKGIGKELEGITDRTDRKFLLDVYKRKLKEIKAKYPDVDLTQFPQPKELSGWDKFMEKVGF